MPYVIALLVGIVAGALCMFLCVMQWVGKVAAREKAAEAKAKSARDAIQAAQAKEAQFARAAAERQEQFDHLVRVRTGELDARAAETSRMYDEAKRIQSDLQSRVVSYRELQEENAILKRDLQNIDVNLHKLELDGEQRQQRQADIDARSSQLAKRYLSETVKSVVASVGPNNFAACKTRLTDVIQRVRDIGFLVPAEEEAKLLTSLRTEFEKAVRADFERQEQARVKAQIREEERLNREMKGRSSNWNVSVSRYRRLSTKPSRRRGGSLPRRFSGSSRVWRRRRRRQSEPCRWRSSPKQDTSTLFQTLVHSAPALTKSA
jgi:hypothetical protein